MRKFLIRTVGIVALVAAIVIAWLFAGPRITTFFDSFWTIETKSEPVQSIRYEGSGSGGSLRVNQLDLNLTPSNSASPLPSVGSSKDGQLALAIGGKVFAFGPLPKTKDDGSEELATTPQTGDEAVIKIRHSAIPWPTPLEANFMTGQSPTWKRYVYHQLTWKRASGSKLEMLWRYEQYFYGNNGWTDAAMTRDGITGLIRVDVQP